MASSHPLVCVFLKLPPSHQSVWGIYEIAWIVFLPQLVRLNNAIEATQATHPATEVKKIWSEARARASYKMAALQSVSITCNDIALGFLAFLHTLRTGRGKDEIYRAFLTSTRGAFNLAGIAQAAMLDFREDIRIVVGRIITILSSEGKNITTFTTESSQSLLELATGVEECNAILEEYREAIIEAQRQSLDENDNPPSEEEFLMVQEKWQAYKVIAEPTQYDWPQLKDAVIGDEDYDGPAMSSSDLAESTLPSDFLKSHRFSFWRKFFQRISSAFQC
ncbi:hypothetical protein AGABI1DRAFT_128711 [Agaricus bisporus var. burnettii JB137-S8]|uniref:Uncharacterized protein n=1 Tax=Agaricus bisporus var. burnettii (strain JB137-S8 / ATCC MYA-4627 / FGSC 10392) TaxID=597362 RepID=K5VYL9_AGABU|nr:uncharacterized protein AGABI1DRAFT_128711 [Agaricus bisporus var. burnettii JB137-S8]EKM79564.1 hypothetical protein AGABI1DRAFT_128711 [Agaricus bisporus var. burnettii JB137-S8]